MITREDVADLRPGDVIEITHVCNEAVYTTRGPVLAESAPGALSFETYWLRNGRGDAPSWIDSLTVISRAKPPLYVNSDRTEPVPGDVVRDADGNDDTNTYSPVPWNIDRDIWWENRNGDTHSRSELPDRLRLLVDGTTGLPPAVTS